MCAAAGCPYLGHLCASARALTPSSKPPRSIFRWTCVTRISYKARTIYSCAWAAVSMPAPSRQGIFRRNGAYSKYLFGRMILSEKSATFRDHALRRRGLFCRPFGRRVAVRHASRNKPLASRTSELLGVSADFASFHLFRCRDRRRRRVEGDDRE